ncbi:MAG: T9SS type A sorting domain-containing protein, partial [Saprospiraceae bacterium]
TITVEQLEGSSKLESVQIFDLTGRLILERKTVEAKLLNIDLNHFKTGVYTVLGKHENGVYAGRFVKF